MRKLDLKENSKVIGGTAAPSDRRCDRLYRRWLNGSESAGDTFLRIC